MKIVRNKQNRKLRIKKRLKRLKKEENFPGPGAYNVMGEGKAKEVDKTQNEKGKKDDNKKGQQLEYATYLTESMTLCHLAPGPGNYNPIDNCIWNRIARDTNDKKGTVGSSKG